MDQKELIEILKEIGWSKAELSRRMGYSKATVTRWVEVPEPVAKYLRLVKTILT